MRLMETFDATAATLDALSDEEFTEYLRDNRPQVLEALASSEGGNMGEPISAEALREALTTDEGKAVLVEVLGTEAKDVVEGMLSTEKDLIRAEARAEAQRPIQLRDLRDLAHSRIDEAKLPEKFAADAKAQFDLDGAGQPTAALNLIDDVDEQFQVTKSASEKLTEAVDEEVARLRELAASVSPTRVKGQGTKSTVSDEEKAKVEEARKASPGTTPAVRELLEGAGFDDPDKVYAGA